MKVMKVTMSYEGMWIRGEVREEEGVTTWGGGQSTLKLYEMTFCLCTNKHHLYIYIYICI
jgi:hypothetical protein